MESDLKRGAYTKTDLVKIFAFGFLDLASFFTAAEEKYWMIWEERSISETFTSAIG